MWDEQDYTGEIVIYIYKKRVCVCGGGVIHGRCSASARDCSSARSVCVRWEGGGA